MLELLEPCKEIEEAKDEVEFLLAYLNECNPGTIDRETDEITTSGRRRSFSDLKELYDYYHQDAPTTLDKLIIALTKLDPSKFLGFNTILIRYCGSPEKVVIIPRPYNNYSFSSKFNFLKSVHYCDNDPDLFIVGQDGLTEKYVCELILKQEENNE